VTVVPEIDIVTALVSRWGCTAMNDNKQMGVTVKGIYPEYDVIENPEIKYGRSINKVDIYENRKVCILGSRIVEELYVGKENPCGEFIQVDGVFYKIVGISGKGSEGMSINGNPATSVIIPFTTLQKAYNRGKRIDLLCFTARKGYNIAEVQDKVEQILKHAHAISPTDTQAVIKVNAEAIFGLIDSLFIGVSVLVWLIGLGTLISGAIGVSNIMVVTVKERTTEIGIRRAIGATPTDILTQIMSESIVLTLVAGLSGITMAVVCLQALENAAQQTSPDSTFQISFGIAVGATLLLATLGVIAGLAPTFKAMAIKPVDAMREE
jgi:putative ABC transport system permease protein